MAVLCIAVWSVASLTSTDPVSRFLVKFRNFLICCRKPELSSHSDLNNPDLQTLTYECSPQVTSPVWGPQMPQATDGSIKAERRRQLLCGEKPEAELYKSCGRIQP